ncbi:MAG: PmoA family protein, partial [Lacipirellulaceae bacterium]
MPITVRWLFALLVSLVATQARSSAEELPVLFKEGFEEGLKRWTTTDQPNKQPVWHIKKGVMRDGVTNHVLRVTGPCSYQPPYRSPHSIAWSKQVVDGTFELTAKVQNTNRNAGPHRDLCFFWGGQDPAHFYYVHLGAKADPHSCQIMIVNGSARKAITQENANSTPWTDAWHQVKVRHETESGLIEVFFDDMKKPRMTTVDKTFTWGRVGLGTFDDHGNFDDVVVRGKTKEKPKVTGEKNDQGVNIQIDGEPFAAYLKKSGHQPVVWPIIGPTGEPVTRSFPLGPLLDNETDDHPHHRSLWFAHGNVNGHDFWLEPTGKNRTEIVHHHFVDLSEIGNDLRLVTQNIWTAGLEKVCEDQRTLIFGGDRDGSRWIDFRIEIMANEGDLTFGDTKEGTFAMRVAGTMKVDAKLDGHLLNSEGQKNVAAWGQPAKWLDAPGPVDDETVGITIFSHPKNFRHPCRWHARNYGLITANPFGKKDFPSGEHKQGPHTIKRGESLELRYKVWLHEG